MVDDETAAQQELLKTYRRTIVHLLQQSAQYGGEVFSPPVVASGLREAREQVRLLKAALRERGVAVADMSIDSPRQPADAPTGSQAPAASVRVDLSGSPNYGAVVGQNSGVITNVVGSPAASAQAPSIAAVLEAVLRLEDAARRRGEEDLADDLQAVALSLRAAQKADAAGRIDRRAAKLGEARDALRRVAEAGPALAALAAALERLAG